MLRIKNFPVSPGTTLVLGPLRDSHQIRSSGKGGVATTWEMTGVSLDQLMPELAPEGRRGLADVGKGVRDALKGTA